MPKNARIAQLDDTLGVLTLSALTVEDSGNYSCSANNSAGLVTYTTSLYVKGVCHSLRLQSTGYLASYPSIEEL